MAASEGDFARVTMAGETVYGARQPLVKLGPAVVALPPGAFLQAVPAAERAMVDFAVAEAQGAARLADLYCGVGTFTFRLAEIGAVHAAEMSAPAIEALKAAIAAKLEKLVRLNRTRADFAEKFEALIESYNNGSRTIVQLFEELLKLSNSLDDEQERHVREHLSEEELVIFDILTRPAPVLTTAERDEVKKVARELLTRLKDLLVLNWRQKSAARSTLKLAIEDALDTLPAAYDRPLYSQKCTALFEHVYESYPERNAGVYAMVA